MSLIYWEFTFYNFSGQYYTYIYIYIFIYTASKLCNQKCNNIAF